MDSALVGVYKNRPYLFSKKKKKMKPQILFTIQSSALLNCQVTIKTIKIFSKVENYNIPKLWSDNRNSSEVQ